MATTSGPSLTLPSKATNVGVASHITAAAPGGARFDDSLTSEQRSGIENGIWLCQTCSALIDRNGGADYSTDLLRKWKVVREAEAARQVGKTAITPLSEIAGTISASGVGVVTGAEITKPTRIAAGTQISAFGVGNITGIKN